MPDVLRTHTIPDYSHRRDRKERRVLYGKTLQANFSSCRWNTGCIVRETGTPITSFLSGLCVLGGELFGLAAIARATCEPVR